MPSVYYSENDPKAAAWLNQLISACLIPTGIVDTRSILDVKASDLTGFKQCHFFAGIGGWAYALQLAGWPADRPVWTGSCPCQPFSTAQQHKKTGFADERHLWPAFFDLIRQCKPPVVFGEQVAIAAGPGVSAKISNAAPRPRSGPTCAFPSNEKESGFRSDATFGGDSVAHRQGSLRTNGLASSPDAWSDVGQPLVGSCGSDARLSVLQHTNSLSRSQQRAWQLGRECLDAIEQGHGGSAARGIEYFIRAAGAELDALDGGTWLSLVQTDLEASNYAVGTAILPAAGVGAPHIRQRLYWVAKDGGAGYTNGGRSGWDSIAIPGPKSATRWGVRRESDVAESTGADCGVADTDGAGSQGRGERGNGADQRAARTASVDSPWANSDWVLCNDPNGERWRPIEPGTQPLAHRVPERVGLLRGYGNAIVPQVAAAFIEAAGVEA